MREPLDLSMFVKRDGGLSHLDLAEFMAAYESITFALASHLRELGTFREAH